MSKNLTTEIDFPSGYVLAVDKPYGWTSSDVVRKIRNLLLKRGFRKIKVGHAGTLDPLATGVLIICIGKATKRVNELQAEQKEYIAEVELGATTPSFDLEHAVDFRFPYEHITKESLSEAVNSFIGEQKQVAPLYSAKWIDGKRAYEYAREGSVDVEIKAVDISIYNAQIINFESPKVTIAISCSKGTYIRSFARDLGLKLQSGGHLTALCRTASGDFRLGECYLMDEVVEILQIANNNGDIENKREIVGIKPYHKD